MVIVKEMTYRVPTWAMLRIEGLDNSDSLSEHEENLLTIFLANVQQPDRSKGETSAWTFEEGGYYRNDVDCYYGDTHIGTLYILAPEQVLAI